MPQDSSSGGAQDADGSTGTAIYQQSSPITSDPSDFAIRFDADPTFFTVSDRAVLDLGNIWSIECWIKRAAISGVFENILDKGLNAYGIGIQADNQIELQVAGVAAIANSTVAITDTTVWHHIVGTKNGATTQIYIDNIECSENNIDVTSSNNTTALFVGDSSFTGSPINAFMDEIAIYGTALSAARVSAHYGAAVTSATAKVFPKGIFRSRGGG